MNELSSEGIRKQKPPSFYRMASAKAESSTKGVTCWKERLQLGLFAFLGGIYLGAVIYYFGMLIKRPLQSLYLGTAPIVLESLRLEVAFSRLFPSSLAVLSDVKMDTVSLDTAPPSVKKPILNSLIIDEQPPISPIVAFPPPHDPQKIVQRVKSLAMIPTASKKIVLTTTIAPVRVSQSRVKSKKNKPKKTIQKTLVTSRKTIKHKLNHKRRATRYVDRKKSLKKIKKTAKKPSASSYQSLEQSLGINLLP